MRPCVSRDVCNDAATYPAASAPAITAAPTRATGELAATFLVRLLALLIDEKAKDDMFAHTDIKQAPWYVVNGDNKRSARLNVISHLLSMIDYEDLSPQPIELPPRQDDRGYVRPPLSDQTFVPELF